MEQGPPPPYEEYVLGEAVPAGFVVHQGLVIPLPIYQVFRLAEVQAPLKLITCIRHIVNLSYQFLQEGRQQLIKCGLKHRQQDTSVSYPPGALGQRGR